MMFSCTIAPAAKSYAIHLLVRRNNMVTSARSLRLLYYFTQRIVYNFSVHKSTIYEKTIFTITR
ncbi:hypothetical protein D7V87_05980 [Clostridium sp. 1xD42-85]|nr:hypothetical protein D7V87_05980 [Clostridium sp. 1xD42-85]